MSMILATSWVRRGVAAEFPQKYEIDEAELSRIEKLARLQLNDAQDDLAAAEEAADKDDDEDDNDEDESNSDAGAPTTENGSTNPARPTDPDDLAEYNLSDYDNDEVDQTTAPMHMFGGVRNLAYHQPGEEDPYLVLPDGADPDDSDDEREELQILPTDNLVLAAKVEDEVPHLEIFVYEDEAENIYVHHDVMLPAIPLCLEWIDLLMTKDKPDSKQQGNYVAVGMMSPEIEIWDLDVVDGMYPAAILGQEPEEKEEEDTTANGSSKKSKSKKKKKKPKANPNYHVEAVLALAANRQHRNLLASGSADKTIKLWDLNTGKCAKSYDMHNGKVCALDWHPTESTILLSGSADDKTVYATDMRAPDADAPRWILPAEIERVKWDMHDPHFFYVTTEAGTVHYFDARVVPKSHDSPSKAVWTLQAHDGAVSAFDVNPKVPGYLVTGSDDKKVKLWNVQDGKPGMVVARNLDVGRVFSAQFAPDDEVAFRLSVAGSKGQVQIWDTSTNAAVRKIFAGRVKLPEGDVKERIVGADAGGDDDDESDEEEENGNGGEGWESMDED